MTMMKMLIIPDAIENLEKIGTTIIAGLSENSAASFWRVI
jgi:hypothetical protein